MNEQTAENRKVILLAPVEYNINHSYRFVLEINETDKLKSVLKIEQCFPITFEWVGTPGHWYIKTLLENPIGDKIMIDAGQNWYVTGLTAALKEVKQILNIDQPTEPTEQILDPEEWLISNKVNMSTIPGRTCQFMKKYAEYILEMQKNK